MCRAAPCLFPHGLSAVSSLCGARSSTWAAVASPGLFWIVDLRVVVGRAQLGAGSLCFVRGAIAHRLARCVIVVRVSGGKLSHALRWTRGTWNGGA